MKIVSFFDSGTAIDIEDQHAVNFPFVGVADGVSETYYPGKPNNRIYGLSGGQYVSDLFGRSILQALPKENARGVALRANQEIARFLRKNKLDMSNSSGIPGACFVLAKIGEREIELVQAGDTLAVWLTREGKIGYTPNQVFRHDMEVHAEVARLMKKYKGDRAKMWADLGPNFLARLRKLRVNKRVDKGYGLLNGQERAPRFWFYKHLKNIKEMIIFTDGLAEYKKTNDKQYLASLLNKYHREGVAGILNKTRAYERKIQKLSHTTYAEATGIAFEL